MTHTLQHPFWSTLLLVVALALPGTEDLHAQPFGEANKITTSADQAASVYATDIDGDGDTDVLSASAYDDTIAWYENDGTADPSFTRRTVTNGADFAVSVYATDVDGDGDTDVLSASLDGTIAWYEHDGQANPSFTRRTIATDADGAESVFATDVDGDGYTDVLSASQNNDTIAWYEHDGTPTPSFTKRTITTDADGARSVFATDVDGDGDTDVLSASAYDNTIAWYENDGQATPSFTKRTITTNADGAFSVFATDVDGDGDTDVLSASISDDTIAWYEHDGQATPSFTTRTITTDADGALSVFATDVDGDGDTDVLSASFDDDTIAWYEHDGQADPAFTKRTIATDARGAQSVFATDVDGDGGTDVLSASWGDDTVAWYENKRITAPRPADPSRLTGPPRLTTTRPTFTDANGDNRLTAGETATLRFTITNDGQGPAQNVRVAGQVDASITGVQAAVGRLAPGTSRTVELTLEAQDNLQDGTATLTLPIREGNGFHPAPLEVTIPTRAFRPPQLVVRDVALDDRSGNGNGQIDPGEVVEITARIVNAGRGEANAVRATVQAGENVFMNGRERGGVQQDLGTIPPGRYADVTVQAFCNSEAEGFPLRLRARESTGEHGLAAQDLGLEVGTSIQSPQRLVVEADPTEPQPAAVPRLSVDIWENLPDTQARNPDAVGVVVGIRDYQSASVPSVEYARRDATIMRRYLADVLGYDASNILPRDPDRPMTAGALKTLIQEQLPDYLKNGSDIFVYFSGHGAPSTGENPHAYLVPQDADPNYVSDANAYRLTHFYEDLVRAAEEHDAGSLTVVLDACFTGQSGSGDMLIRQASPLTLTVENPVLAYENGTAFTASASDQLATWYPEKRHGMFTYFFLKGLKGAADADGNGQITVAELERYLTDENDGVPYWSRRIHSREQVPQVQTREDERVLVEVE